MLEVVEPLNRSVQYSARVLGVSESTLYGYIKAGAIKVIRLGKRILIADTELNRLLSEGTDKLPLTRPRL